MSKVWAILKSDPVSAFLYAVFLFLALCIISWARGGDCNQRIVKHKQNVQKILVPYNYGHQNVLLELPVDAAYSAVAYPIGVPVGTYAPVTYVAATEGDGLQQPRLIRRITEEYAEPEDMPVEEVVAEEVAEPEVCEPQKQAAPCAKPACETHRAATPKSSHPGLAVAKEACASCHTGAKAKAEHRPVFFDDAGKFIATAQQKQKILDAARAGRMPPKGPLDEDDYIALSSWLKNSAAKQSKAALSKPTVEELMAEIQALKGAIQSQQAEVEVPRSWMNALKLGRQPGHAESFQH